MNQKKHRTSASVSMANVQKLSSKVSSTRSTDILANCRAMSTHGMAFTHANHCAPCSLRRTSPESYMIMPRVLCCAAHITPHEAIRKTQTALFQVFIPYDFARGWRCSHDIDAHAPLTRLYILHVPPLLRRRERAPQTPAQAAS
jgi:hypothetical protein